MEALMGGLPIGSYALLDNSPEGLRLARERFAPVYGGRVAYVMDDVFSASLARRFDVVFSVGLIEHFGERDMARLVELHQRWAADDGLVIIAVPTPTIFYRTLRTLWAQILTQAIIAARPAGPRQPAP
jgi:cyclopropane fatty-acyl-phospholipid synthase-like methyltransferase